MIPEDKAHALLRRWPLAPCGEERVAEFAAQAIDTLRLLLAEIAPTRESGSREPTLLDPDQVDALRPLVDQHKSRKTVPVGERFGRLTVIDRASSQSGRARWLCRCDCGEVTAALIYVLRHGRTRSCGSPGCREWRKSGRPRKQVHDLVGQRRGRLLVLDRDLSQGHSLWRCRCDCGRIVLIPGGKIAMRRTCGHRDCAGNASASTGPRGGDHGKTKAHESTRSLAGIVWTR